MKNRIDNFKVILAGMLFTFFLVSQAGAQTVATGSYTVPNAEPPITLIRQTTGLGEIKALLIVEFSPIGKNATAYTTDRMQEIEAGMFLNRNKWWVPGTSGIALIEGDFAVNHPDFIKPGSIYFWEARGDDRPF